MTRPFTASIEIDAPAERVWAILTDLDRYPEWSPFTPRIVSTLRPGDRVELEVRMFGISLRQVGRITAVVPGRELRWRVVMRWPWLHEANRSQIVEDLGGGRSRYLTTDAFQGVLAPITRGAVGGRVQRGFEATARALKARAERE